MIHMPRRSVTRFFIPLIDVMILLFCIFLLLPVFKEAPDNPDADAKKKSLNQEEELKKLRAELAELRKGQRGVAVRVLEVDPRTGALFYYQKGERQDLDSAAKVAALVARHEREAKDQAATGSPAPELRYIILYPPPALESVQPTGNRLKDYEHWFGKTHYVLDKRGG